MDIHKAREKFLSNKVVDHIVRTVEDILNFQLSNDEIKYIHKCMKVAANEPQFFEKPTLRDCCDTISNVSSKYINRARYTDMREDMTKRVMSESGKYVPMKPIDEVLPSIFELIGQDTPKRPVIFPNDHIGDSEERAGLINRNSGLSNLLNMELAVGSIFGLANPRDVVSALGLRYRHILLSLDTRNRILIDDATTSALRSTASWNYFTGAQIDQGSATSNNVINNIIGIECGDICFPNYWPEQFNEFRQVSMFIHEISDQAAIISQKTRHHFLFNVEALPGSSNRVKLKSVYSDISEIRFASPITTINTLTVSFAAPFNRVILGWDRSSNVVVAKSIGVGSPTGFTLGNAHNLSNGDLVYLEGFTTGAPTTDFSTISLANRDEGHIISGVTTFYFEIAGLDTNATTGALTVTNVIYGSRRFLIPLKFKCLLTI